MKISEIRNGNMNNVYLFEINDNKYIIRESIFDNIFECKVLNILKEININCPKIITNFKLDNKYIILYKYLEGQCPTKTNNKFYINLAKLLNKLHSIPYSFTKEDYLLNEENQEKLHNYYLKTINSKYLFNDKAFIKEIYNNISNLNLDIFDKCIIHSDIKKENMIQNKRNIYLIDFGNCYIGTRLIDIIRVIMWFFIKNDDYNYKQIELFIKEYFTDNQLTELEMQNINELIIYCILYNLLKDIALYEDGVLKAEYIENNSLNWLNALKEKGKLLKIGELIKNAKRFTK